MKEDGATLAKLIDKSSIKGDFVIPGNVVDIMDCKFVLIVRAPSDNVSAPNDNQIQIFPLYSNTVVKIEIKIGSSLSNEFMVQINKVFAQANLTSHIYQPGLKFIDDAFYYESYFDKRILTIPITELEKQIHNIESVSDVIIKDVN